MPVSSCVLLSPRSTFFVTDDQYVKLLNGEVAVLSTKSCSRCLRSLRSSHHSRKMTMSARIQARSVVVMNETKT